MAATPTSQYQARMTTSLTRTFEPIEVRSEWKAFEGRNGLYSPRIDIAVGPFSTIPGSKSEAYDRLERKYRRIIDRLRVSHAENLKRFETQVPHVASSTSANRNARCFFAIEIENRVSRKHLMGGALNAAALGRWGIVVGWDHGKVKALIRLREYLLELARVGKPTFTSLANLLIVNPGQLRAALARTV